MKKNINIDAYLNMVENKFSNIGGVWDNGQGYAFFGDTQPSFQQPMSNFSRGQFAGTVGTSAGAGWHRADGGGEAIVPAKQPTPYQVNVTNTTAGTLTLVLFGNNTYLLTANFGSSVGLTVTPAQSNVSYLELLQQSASNPFSTSLIRVQANTSPQMTQIISVTSKDANGQTCTIPIITNSYFSAQQFQSTILDVPYSLKIDGNTYLTIPILAGAVVSYTFFPAEKINPSRNLVGGDQQQVYANPNVPLLGVPMFAPVGAGQGQLMVGQPNQ